MNMTCNDYTELDGISSIYDLLDRLLNKRPREGPQSKFASHKRDWRILGAAQDPKKSRSCHCHRLLKKAVKATPRKFRGSATDVYLSWRRGAGLDIYGTTNMAEMESQPE